ncbi:MAG: HAD family hydrolase [Candidatus Zixiibacteriota bacterium]
MQKLKPRAIIFDLGSTLIEYEVVSWDQLNQFCSQSARQFLIAEGYLVPDEAEFHAAFESAKSAYRKAASETLVEWDVPTVAAVYLDALQINFPSPRLDEFFDAYYAPVDRLLYIYDDTIAALELLKARFGVIGLISNTVFPERAHRRELRRFGIEPFLNFAIFSSTFGLRKPHPDIFLKAAELAGAEPSECVYVGDRYVEDILGPAAVGMPAILRVKEGREYPADMPESVRKVATLTELHFHIEI